MEALRALETVTSADGTSIAVERTGGGPPLVLVYGNGDVYAFWELAGVRPAFAEHRTVYAIERRGRGENPHDALMRTNAVRRTNEKGDI